MAEISIENYDYNDDFEKGSGRDSNNGLKKQSSKPGKPSKILETPSTGFKSKNGKIKYPSGTTSLTDKSFNKHKTSKDRSMYNAERKTSNSYSKIDGNSINSINGADTFLSRLGKSNNFDSDFYSIIEDIKIKIQKLNKLRKKFDESYE
jgi:hypothetical protein